MKYQVGDIVYTSEVYGQPRIGIIVCGYNSAEKKFCGYDIIICGYPQLNATYIKETEVKKRLFPSTQKKKSHENCK